MKGKWEKAREDKIEGKEKKKKRRVWNVWCSAVFYYLQRRLLSAN